MAADYRYVVYDSAIQTMFDPGGSIHRWTTDFTREVEAEAVRRCPVAREQWGLFRVAGGLKMGHRSTVGTNRFGTVGSVRNDRSYAMYVHDGTSTVVARGRYMKFNINGRTFRKKEVRGQRAQPWLRDALAVVSARHGLG